MDRMNRMNRMYQMLRTLHRLFLLSCVLGMLTSRVCLADMVGYDSRTTIRGQNSRISAVHFHDWSDKTRGQRYALFSSLNHHEQIFSPEKNQFSYLKLFDRATGNLIFRASVPALTHLWISPDSKFVVGLSSIMLLNPYQVVVFTIDGKLLYKEHISSEVAVLTQAELTEYFRQFPKAKALLLPRTRTIGDKAYVDGYIGGMPNVIGDRAFDRLLDFSQRHPYSPNFGQSVTNFVFWFDQRNPQVKMQEEGTALRLWLIDRKGQPFSIRVDDTVTGIIPLRR
jgi:hypothetical protein